MLIKSITLKANKNKLSEGFTLIELLIVMAVIGVLAAIVLVAINPIEQLARGRDAARIQAVGQLGRVYSNYATAQGITTYPVAAAGWETTLTGSGDLANVISSPSNTANCGAAANRNSAASMFCYAPTQVVTANDNFTIWTMAESQNEITKYGACANKVAIVFMSNLGKVQLDCIAAAGVPAPGDTFVNP